VRLELEGARSVGTVEPVSTSVHRGYEGYVFSVIERTSIRLSGTTRFSATTPEGVTGLKPRGEAKRNSGY